MRLEGDTVTLRPIAGTRPRGLTREDDQRPPDESGQWPEARDDPGPLGDGDPDGQADQNADAGAFADGHRNTHPDSDGDADPASHTNAAGGVRARSGARFRGTTKALVRGD